jgi:hypothetical protein
MRRALIVLHHKQQRYLVTFRFRQRGGRNESITIFARRTHFLKQDRNTTEMNVIAWECQHYDDTQQYLLPRGLQKSAAVRLCMGRRSGPGLDSRIGRRKRGSGSKGHRLAVIGCSQQARRVADVWEGTISVQPSMSRSR